LKPRGSEKADEVLRFLNDSFDMDKKIGRGLSREEDSVRRQVLMEYPALGRSPRVKEIAEALDMEEKKVKALLKSLDSKDVLYLDPTGEIRGAYPFKEQSDYEVLLKDAGKVYAMCAVDALGIPYMLDKDAAITSKCTYCGREIRIKVENKEVTRHNGDIVVWAGKTCCSFKAATSVCHTLNFFCSREHAEKWRNEEKQEGWALTLPEALYVGKKLFGDALK